MRQPDQMKGGELYLEQVEWVLKMWRVRQVPHHNILQEAVADEMGGQIDEFQNFTLFAIALGSLAMNPELWQKE